MNIDGIPETLPKQCEKCVLLYMCMELHCTKETPCLSRQEPINLDPDFVQEMRERAGI